MPNKNSLETYGIRSFEDYWKRVCPDIDPEDKSAVNMVAMQKSAALSGWQGAMEQMRRFLQSQNGV